MNTPNATTIDSGQTDLSRIVTGAGATFIGTLLRAVFAFGFSLLLSRALPVSDLGLYTIGFTVSVLAVFLCLLGLDTGLWRFVSSFSATKDESRLLGTILSALGLAVPTGFIFAALLAIFAEPVSNKVFGDPNLTVVLRVFSATIPLLVAARLFNAATQGFQKMHYTAIRDIFEHGLRLIIAGALFLAGYRLGGALMANFLAIAFVAGLSFYFLEKMYPLLSLGIKPVAQLGTLVKFSLPMGISSILTYLLIWMDTLMLGYFRSSEEVGQYSVAIRIIVVAAIFQTSFNTMFAPVISDLFVRREGSQLMTLFKRVTRWIFTLSLPVFLPLLLFSGNVLRIFGNQFEIASASLLILAIGQLVNASTGPVGGVLSMSGRSGLELANSFMSWIVSVILCILLIPKWGLPGAAIANASSITLVNLARAGEVYAIFGFHAYDGQYLKPVGAALLAAGAAYLGYSRSPLDPDSFISLLVWTAVFLVVYLSGVLLLGLDEEDSRIARNIKARFLKSAVS